MIATTKTLSLPLTLRRAFSKSSPSTSKDQRTTRLLSVLAIFLLRMYENSLVLGWLKRLATARNVYICNDAAAAQDDDELDAREADLLRKWVSSRQEWLIRVWAQHLSLMFIDLSPSSPINTTASTTHSNEDTKSSRLRLTIPSKDRRGRARTLTWEDADQSCADPSTCPASTSTYAACSASIEVAEDVPEYEYEKPLVEVTEVRPAAEQCALMGLVASSSQADAERNSADDSPLYTYPELSPVRYTHQLLWSEDDAEFDDDEIVLPHWCPVVPSVVIHFCENHEPEALDCVATPTQFTQYGSRLCVPGFLSYEDENVSPAVWERWEHEEDSDEEGTASLTATTDDEEDSEAEDDVKTWSYYLGDPPVETPKNAIQHLAVPDEEVKTTFWIDEDEDDLPDISDWS